VAPRLHFVALRGGPNLEGIRMAEIRIERKLRGLGWLWLLLALLIVAALAWYFLYPGETPVPTTTSPPTTGALEGRPAPAHGVVFLATAPRTGSHYRLGGPNGTEG
jgi:hypothetical protein